MISVRAGAFVFLLLVEGAYGWLSRKTRIHGQRHVAKYIISCHAASSDGLFDVSTWQDDHWVPDQTTTTTLRTEVQETWNWCRHFVATFGLCPWALKSTETKHAVHIYVLEDSADLEDAVESAALEFHRSCKDPQTAISFVIICDKNNNSILSFEEHYDRFMDLEDSFVENDGDDDDDENSFRNQVTLAPFHPDWAFAGDDHVLSFEKRSPYATISIVSAQAIEQAGPAATEHIGQYNAKILNSRSVEEWQSIYNQAIDPSHNP